jgi:hypothetical protein
MNIDGRLDRSTERHEALAQTVELLTADVRALTGAVKLLAREHKRLDSLVTDIAGTTRLMRAIDSHEQRIGDLKEGQQPKQ